VVGLLEPVETALSVNEQSSFISNMCVNWMSEKLMINLITSMHTEDLVGLYILIAFTFDARVKDRAISQPELVDAVVRDSS
jgi:hypothetical protein